MITIRERERESNKQDLWEGGRRKEKKRLVPQRTIESGERERVSEREGGKDWTENLASIFFFHICILFVFILLLKNIIIRLIGTSLIFFL